MKKVLATLATAVLLGSGIALSPVNQAPAEAVPYTLPAGTWGSKCYHYDQAVKWVWGNSGQWYQLRHRVEGYKYYNGYYWYCGIKYNYYYYDLVT